MRLLAVPLEFVIVAVPAAAVILIAVRILQGRISLHGLLSDSTGAFSPGRLQLLIATVVASGFFLGDVMSDPGRTDLPELPGWFTTLFLTSGSVYLAGKAVNLATAAGLLRRLFH